MKVYVVEQYSVHNMSDTVLDSYDIFSSKEKALTLYPEALIEADYPNELDLESSIDKELNKMFGVCYVLVEDQID